MISRLNHNRYLLIVDAFLIILAAPLSFLIRLDASSLFIQFLPIMAVFAGIGVIVKLSLFWAFGLYRQFWRYASVSELRLVVTTVTVSSLVLTVLFVAVLLPYGLLWRFPRSVLLIDWLLQLIFVGGIRFLIRVSAESSGGGEPPGQSSRQKRALIAGAGDAGAIIVREMQHNPHLGIIPIAFVDDDLNKVGRRIHNVPVLGQLSDIPHLVQQWYIHEVVIAMPTASGKVIRKIARACEEANVASKTMPGLYELLSGTVSVSQIREVQIEDLLRREPVEVDEPSISSYLEGKRVLITGAGGSIGSELARQVARYGPACLILLGHGENSIYAIDQEMQSKFLDLQVKPCIADIRDAARIEFLFDHYQPQVVFHAAAHKHVPLMEVNAVEAVSNNVLGTKNVLEAARRAQTERFVLISSDKAVDPISVMGTSKRVAELLVQDMAQCYQLNFVTVRFGNVLGSRGSVVPLFKQQIAQGGPVTITHPDMTRFFMTIPEAVHLVIQAGALGRGGETFILDMGLPVKIVDLARDLIELSGLEVGRDIDIVFTELRSGEKLSEQLCSGDEMIEQTSHPKIVKVRSRTPAALRPAELQTWLEQLRGAVRAQDEELVFRCLKDLLPQVRLEPFGSGS